MKTLTILLLLLLISCGGVKQGMSNHGETKKSKTHIKGQLFETLVTAQIGGFNTPQIQVVKERQALNTIYGQINKTRKPGFDVPKINFKEETIVAVFMGKKNSGGYAVDVVKLEEKKDKIIITVKETNPEPSAILVTAITQPFCVIKLNNTAKELVFEKI